MYLNASSFPYILSIASIIVSLFTLYFTTMRKGKIEFHAANAVYAVRIAGALNNDILAIPIFAANTGVYSRGFRLKVVVNNKTIFHPYLQMDTFNFAKPFVNPNNNSLDLTLAKIIILPPRGSSGGLIGFTQSLGEFNKFIGESLQIDVWYDEGNKWQRGFRVIWGNWKSQLDSMLQTTKTWNSNLSPDKLLYDFIGTSEAYTFQRKFNPSYSEDLLKTDFIIEKA